MNRALARTLVTVVSRGVGALRSGPRPGLRILLYHSIGDTDPRDAYGSAVPAWSFAEQVRWLREESGLDVVSLAEGVERLGAGAPGTAIAVTFDDGYRDTLTVAAPILARHRIPFTVFVPGAFLVAPPVAGRYLDAVALRDLAAVPGASIGAHGHSHRPLPRLADEALRAELRASVAELATVTGALPITMSYPHGATDRRVQRCARQAGFTLGATSLIGVNGSRVPRMRLRRTEIVSADTGASFAARIRGDYDWYRIKQRLYWPVPAA